MLKDIKPKEDHGETLASWAFPEFIKYKRTKSWYFWMIALLVALIIFSVSTQNYLLLVIVALLVLIYYIRSKREPEMIKFSITEDGIEIGETFYPYKDIKSFWIIYEPPEVKNLYINFKSLKPHLSIPLENQNPLKVRKALLNYIKEDLTKENETFSDGLTRMLKL